MTHTKQPSPTPAPTSAADPGRARALLTVWFTLFLDLVAFGFRVRVVVLGFRVVVRLVSALFGLLARLVLARRIVVRLALGRIIGVRVLALRYVSAGGAFALARIAYERVNRASGRSAPSSTASTMKSYGPMLINCPTTSRTLLPIRARPSFRNPSARWLCSVGDQQAEVT